MHNFYLTPPPKQRDFHKAVIFEPGNVDAPTSGYGRLEFTLVDDALPNLRRANDLSRPASGLRRNGRHCLCVPPLRCRAGPDIDAHQNVPQKYGVMSIPTLLLFKNGQVADQIVGAVPKAKLDAMVKRAI